MNTKRKNQPPALDDDGYLEMIRQDIAEDRARGLPADYQPDFDKLIRLWKSSRRQIRQRKRRTVQVRARMEGSSLRLVAPAAGDLPLTVYGNEIVTDEFRIVIQLES